MKLSKGQGISLFAAIILFAIFNIVVFVAPLVHTIAFWLGYFFALFALITIALTLTLYFGKTVKEEKFLGLPAVKTAWTYFVLQTALSVWEMTVFPLSYLPALVINLVLGAVFVVVILALYAAADKIDKAEQFTAEKVVFIKQLKMELDSIETDDAVLAKKVKELAENVRFSDPMSHSKLVEIETALSESVNELTNSIGDTEKALTLCDQVAKLLKKRNEQCKMYKGVKDTVAAEKQKSGNGKGVAFAGVCAALAMGLVTLLVCFVIIPQVKYNAAVEFMEAEKYIEATIVFADLGNYRDSEEKLEEIKITLLDIAYDAATALMDAEKYDEATVAFTELGDYRDSKEKIEEIKIILLDKEYAAAVALLDEEKYDEATAAFTELGDYRDSKEKIEEIKFILLDNQYTEAERLFNEGKYSEAINIYSTLGDFKDSKLRVEQIYNRLSEGDIIYFGTYNGEPIAWKILKTESDKMLLIAEKPIAQKPFHDEIKKVTWETSSLRAWLNNEFLESFSPEQQNQILATETGETTDKIFLMDVDEMDELVKREKITFKTSEEWWTRTATENGIMYTASTGWVQAEGDQIVRDKGVRPSIWISLEKEE